MYTTEHVVDGVTHTLLRHDLRLIAVGLLPPLDADNDAEESSEFNAAAHIHYFNVTLEVYGVDPDTWPLCHCADNAAVNIKIAKVSE